MINPNSNVAGHNELSFDELKNVSGGSPVIETLIQIGISAAYDYLKDTGVLEAVNRSRWSKTTRRAEAADL